MLTREEILEEMKNISDNGMCNDTINSMYQRDANFSGTYFSGTYYMWLVARLDRLV